MKKIKIIIITIFALIALISVKNFTKSQLKKLRTKENTLKDLKNLENDALSLVIDKLKVYKTYDKMGPIALKRIGRDHDGGYVVPEKALKEADVLFGYGIADDISFEESFSDIYNKPSYGFDCGTKHISTKNKKCKFISQCIGTDEFLYKGQKSSETVKTFREQIKEFHVEERNIFIKMDIEGAEYQAIDSVLKHSQNITGIAIEVHFTDAPQILKLIDLLTKINKEFKLVHIHANNSGGKPFRTPNLDGTLPRVLELSYINNNLIEKFEISENQKFPKEIDMVNVPSLNDYNFEIKV